jgi:hypothetical protein
VLDLQSAEFSWVTLVDVQRVTLAFAAQDQRLGPHVLRKGACSVRARSVTSERENDSGPAADQHEGLLHRGGGPRYTVPALILLQPADRLVVLAVIHVAIDPRGGARSLSLLDPQLLEQL